MTQHLVNMWFEAPHPSANSCADTMIKATLPENYTKELWFLLFQTLQEFASHPCKGVNAPMNSAEFNASYTQQILRLKEVLKLCRENNVSGKTIPLFLYPVTILDKWDMTPTDTTCFGGINTRNMMAFSKDVIYLLLTELPFGVDLVQRMTYSFINSKANRDELVENDPIWPFGQRLLDIMQACYLANTQKSIFVKNDYLFEVFGTRTFPSERHLHQLSYACSASLKFTHENKIKSLGMNLVSQVMNNLARLHAR